MTWPSLPFRRSGQFGPIRWTRICIYYICPGQPVRILTSIFSIHYSLLPPEPLLRLPRSYPRCFRSHNPRSFPRNDESYFVRCFHRYFVRYLASYDASSLSGSLPHNNRGSFPSSIVSSSPRSGPDPRPNSSASNLAGNLRSLLGRNEDRSDARCSPFSTESRSGAEAPLRDESG